MKKFMFMLMSAILLPVSVVMFSACGAGQFTQANLDVRGNYAQKQASEVTEVVSGENLNAYKGFRMSMDATMKLGEETANMSIVMLYKDTSTEDASTYESAMKVSGTMGTESGEAEMYSRFEEGTMKIYIKTAQKGQETTKISYEGSSGMFESMNTITGSVQDFLPDVSALESAGKIEVAENGSVKKIKLTIGSDDTTNATIYYVYDGENFKGMKIENMVVAELGMTLNATLVPFDGDIAFPNFSDYKPAVTPGTE